MLWGVAGGVVGAILTSFLVIGWRVHRETTVTIDTVEKREGTGSLRWSLRLTPERRFIFSVPRLSGALLHVETGGDAQGTIVFLDWHEFASIRFIAKSSVSDFSMSEINIFVDAHLSQYTFDKESELLLSTGWREIDVPLREFRRPAWSTGAHDDVTSALRQVAAFGFDVKNRMDDLQASVWIDAIRMVRPDGTAVMFFDGDTDTFEFRGHRLTWFVGTRDY